MDRALRAVLIWCTCRSAMSMTQTSLPYSQPSAVSYVVVLTKAMLRPSGEKVPAPPVVVSTSCPVPSLLIHSIPRGLS